MLARTSGSFPYLYLSIWEAFLSQEISTKYLLRLSPMEQDDEGGQYSSLPPISDPELACPTIARPLILR